MTRTRVLAALVMAPLAIAAVLGLAGGIGQLVIFYRPPAKQSA